MTGQERDVNDLETALTPARFPQNNGSGYEISLIDVLIQLARRKGLIARFTGAAMAVGLLIVLLWPPKYTATTKLMPPQQVTSSASMLMGQLASSGSGGALAAMAGTGLGLKSPNEIYIGMLTSRPIADAIIQKFELVRVYHVKDMTAARKKLASYTDVSAEKSGFISVSVRDEDKKRVAEMANAYTDQLRILTKTLAVTEASQRRLFYEDQLKQAKEALVAAELSFQQVQQKQGVVQLDAQAKAMIESLAALRAQVAAKQVEVQALRSYSTEKNPEVQLAEHELSTMQGEVARLEERNHSTGFSDIGLRDVPGAGLDYLRAEHEVKYQQALFDLLMRQYDAAKLDESKDAAIIQVVEPAIEPDKRTSPKRVLVLATSMFAGFFAGCLLALLLWWYEFAQLDPEVVGKLQYLCRSLRWRESHKL